MDLNEKIRLYLSIQESSAPQAKKLRKEIERDILKLCYYLPQKLSFLKEEDAGEFTLLMHSQIDYIISNYKPEKSSFSCYMTSFLSNRVKQFYHNKSKLVHKERAVMRHHTYYEEKLNYEEKQNRIYDPPVYIHMPESWCRKLSYAFYQSRAIHRRFFVSALTVMPFMGRSSIREICRIFRFDFTQTAFLCEYFRKLCLDQIEKKEHLEYRRNFYWNKVIELEAESAASRDLTPTEDSDMQLLRKINQIHHQNRLHDIDRHTTRVPYKNISEELNVSIRYIETAVFHTRNLMLWISGESIELSKSNKIAGAIAEGRWQSDIHYDQVPMLVPSEVFESRLFTRREK